MGHEARECLRLRDKNEHELPYGERLKAGFRGLANNLEGRSRRLPHRDNRDDGFNGGRVPSSITQMPCSNAVTNPAGTKSTNGNVTNHSYLHGANLMGRNNHEATNAGTDNSISGFTAT